MCRELTAALRALPGRVPGPAAVLERPPAHARSRCRRPRRGTGFFLLLLLLLLPQSLVTVLADAVAVLAQVELAAPETCKILHLSLNCFNCVPYLGTDMHTGHSAIDRSVSTNSSSPISLARTDILIDLLSSGK